MNTLKGVVDERDTSSPHVHCMCEIKRETTCIFTYLYFCMYGPFYQAGFGTGFPSRT